MTTDDDILLCILVAIPVCAFLWFGVVLFIFGLLGRL